MTSYVFAVAASTSTVMQGMEVLRRDGFRVAPVGESLGGTSLGVTSDRSVDEVEAAVRRVFPKSVLVSTGR